MSDWNISEDGEKIVLTINGVENTYFNLDDIPSSPTKEDIKNGSGSLKVKALFVNDYGDDRVTALRDREIATIGAQEGRNALMDDFQTKFDNIGS